LVQEEIAMKLAGRVKSISYLKANAPEVIRSVAERREPMVITQRGEAKAVLQDIASYEEAQETLAFLKILALAQADVEQGKVRPAREAFARVRASLKG
jgi:prevent-host-death family protein